MADAFTITPAAQGAGAQPTTPEPVKPPETQAAPPPEKKDDSVARRFADLAKKEKGIFLKAQDLKAKEAAISEKLARAEAYEKAQQDAKLNPLAALEKLGLTYEDVTSFVLADKKPTPDLQVKAVRDELETFKKQQLEERQKLIEEEKKRLAAEQEKAIATFKSECVDFVKSNAAEYELTALHDASDLVFELITENFEKTQRVMAVKEAADLVEKYLEEQIEKSTATQKWQARSKAPTPKEPEKRTEAAQQRTLTNGLTATAHAYQSNPGSDRVARALAAMDKANGK